MSEHHQKDYNRATTKLLEILRKEVYKDNKPESDSEIDPGVAKKKKEVKSQQLSLFPFLETDSEPEK
ncbi:MAG: hypothetical protein DRP86_04925 [Candidatus Neomarinimicrobiota bacterium]|nr:MAG: hypothetical protein DRP86_04925 [Candidatus Neomarinimicrobiota bacterium]